MGKQKVILLGIPFNHQHESIVELIFKTGIHKRIQNIKITRIFSSLIHFFSHFKKLYIKIASEKA